MKPAAELIESEVKWQGRVIRAGVARYRHPDGVEVTRDKVWHPGAVGIIALDDEHVWLTRQPREVIDAAASLEIPAGKLDVPGEPPIETAKRELVEEIGKRAERWEELLVFYTSPGFSDERV
ncbi:MAG: NUDIX domain-containing protein, partial [Solirubrobacteraceae bacterium]